jgi:hypothetical protein
MNKMRIFLDVLSQAALLFSDSQEIIDITKEKGIDNDLKESNINIMVMTLS